MSIQDAGVEEVVTTDETTEKVDRLRARIHDVASELRPLPNVSELIERVHSVSVELHRIEQELQVVVHVALLEDGDIERQLADIDTRLAAGWKPDARDVDDIVADFRAEFS